MHINEKYKLPLLCIVLCVISYFFKVIFHLILSNHLSAAIYGDVALAFRILGITAPVVLMGSNSAVIKYLPHYFYSKSISSKTFFKWNLKVLLVGSVILYSFVAVFSLCFFVLHLFKVTNIYELHIGIQIVWLSPLVGANIILANVILARKKYFISIASKTVFKYFFRLIILLIMLLFAVAIQEFQILLMIALANLIILIFLVIYIIIWIPEVPKIISQVIEHDDSEDKKAWMRFSLIMFASGVMFKLISSIGILLVEILEKDERSVGVYAAILTITGIFWVIFSGLKLYIKPDIDIAFKNSNQKGQLQHKINNINFVLILIALPITIAIVFYANHILAYFNPYFIVGEQALIILSIGLFFIVCAELANPIIAYGGAHKINLIQNICQLVGLLILGGIFTYFYGILGTAIATIIVYLSNNLFAYIFVRQKMGIKIFFI